jgi:hypothetical protein
MRTRLTPFARIAGRLFLLGLVVTALTLPWWPGTFPASPRGAGILVGGRVYLGVLVVLAGVFAAVTRRPGRSLAAGLAAGIGWLELWHGWVVLMVATGGVLGLLLFPLGALVFGVDLEMRGVLAAGLRDGAFYFLIWAPGVAFVLSFMEAHQRRQRAAEARRELDTNH